MSTSDLDPGSLAATKYVFDNAGRQTPARFSALAHIYDAGTIRHLIEVGVNTGWQCLEVGGGGGSIAGWLSERVGTEGQVVVTDIDTRFLEKLGNRNLEVRQHDIALESLPEGTFDLVHTRLVLLHLPGRDEALARLVAALKPGGWLLVEEFDSLAIHADNEINSAETPLKTLSVLQQVLVERGADTRYGRKLPGRLRCLGLEQISAEGRISMWTTHSMGAQLLKANFEQLEDAMLISGLLTRMDFQNDLAKLDTEEFMVPSPIMWSVKARRPAVMS
jgi:SAM-dependent methyltransferase